MKTLTFGRRKLKQLVKCLSKGRWLVVPAAAFSAGLVKLTAPPPWFPHLVHKWVVQNQFWLLALLPVIAVGLDYSRKWIDDRHRKRVERRKTEKLHVAEVEAVLRRESCLQELLEDIVERLRDRFVRAERRGDPPLAHRLTLFRANAEQSRLEIIARSSEATRGSKIAWRIHPDQEFCCEGIAGLCWFHDTSFVVPDLPDISINPTDEAVQEYAEKTFVSPALVREHKWKARSYGATPIRVDGRRWGVLVLDSIDEHGTSEAIFGRVGYIPELLGDIIGHWRRA